MVTTVITIIQIQFTAKETIYNVFVTNKEVKPFFRQKKNLGEYILHTFVAIFLKIIREIYITVF